MPLIIELIAITMFMCDKLNGTQLLVTLLLSELGSLLLTHLSKQPRNNWCAICNKFGHYHGTCT